MKENKIEKLILNLSNRWDCSPQEAVDRLNSMNESEINKLINSMTKKFNNGGFIDCLRAGGKTYAECKKCGGKTPVIKDQEPAEKLTTKTNDGKTRRTDRPGYAWTYADGTDVLTQDAVGPQPLPGSYYEIPGSTPEYETWRTIKTDKGGNPKRYDFKVFVNNGDALGPVGKYTTDNNVLRKILGWKTMPEDMLKEWNGRFSANKLAKGGFIEKAALGTEIGGKIAKVARSTMFDDAKEFMPEANRRFVRQAYRAAKNHGRDLGLTGKSLRNWSKNQVSDRFREYADRSSVNMSVQMPQIPVLEDIVIEDEPIVINDNSFEKLNSKPPIIGLMGSFNKAFRQARNRGLDKFYYSGPDKKAGWFTTDLKKDTPSAQQQEYLYNQQVVENAVESPKMSDKIKAGILSTLNYPMK